MTHNFEQALKSKLAELAYPKDHLYLQGLEKNYPLPIVGCTEDEILEIMRVQQVQDLPKLYIDFLKSIGKHAGDLWIGYDFTFPYLTAYNFRDSANISLSYYNHKLLGDDKYVFLNKQSAYHWFFSIEEGNDPLVYVFGEDTGKEDDVYYKGPILSKSSLSEFLTLFIAERESLEAQKAFLNKYIRTI